MDKYDKGVLLGRGTFASVFKATHREVRHEKQHSSSRACGTLDRTKSYLAACCWVADREGCGDQEDRRWWIKRGEHLPDAAILQPCWQSKAAGRLAAAVIIIMLPIKP
jgi:hypothetical protein